MKLADAIRDFQLVPPVDPRVSEGRRMAARPTDLRGARVGLLDNRKGNANVLLAALGRGLEDAHGAADVVLREKPIFSRPAPADLLADLATFDVVVTALAD
jgi:hypothetical protein